MWLLFLGFFFLTVGQWSPGAGPRHSHVRSPVFATLYSVIFVHASVLNATQ